MSVKKIMKALRREDGAAQLIEAAIIYPVVFICIGFLLYLGLFILQYITVSAYAQKVALLAAREIAYPGYIGLVSSSDSYSSSSVELDLQDYSKDLSAAENGTAGSVITISKDAKTVKARAYRYWLPDPLKGYEGEFLKILKNMIDKNSILLGRNSAEVSVTSKNMIVATYVYVNVSQPLMENSLLNAVGIKTPTVKVSVMSSANDTDEFIRTTDFVCDALEMLAKKLHIDVDKIKEKVEKAKEVIGLK